MKRRRSHIREDKKTVTIAINTDKDAHANDLSLDMIGGVDRMHSFAPISPENDEKDNSTILNGSTMLKFNDRDEPNRSQNQIQLALNNRFVSALTQSTKSDATGSPSNKVKRQSTGTCLVIFA